MKLSIQLLALPLVAGLALGSIAACGSGSGNADATGGSGNEGGSTSAAGGSTASSSTGGIGGASTSNSGTTAAGGTAATTSTKTTLHSWDFSDGAQKWTKLYAKQYDMTAITDEDKATALGVTLLADTTADYNAGPGYGLINGFFSLSCPLSATQMRFQEIDVGLNMTVPEDWTGATVSCQLRLVGGFQMAGANGNYGGAKLYIKTGPDAWVYASGPYAAFSTTGSWQQFDFEIDNPYFTDVSNPKGTFDATKVIQFGIGMSTPDEPGPGSASAPAGAVLTPGKIDIDSCVVTR